MMPEPSPTFIDHEADRICYLGFDLVLVEAPVRNGIAHTAESRVVATASDDPAQKARNATIRGALLDVLFGDDATLPQLPNGRIVMLAIEAETILPAGDPP